METFKILIGGSPSKLFHLKKFSKKLLEFGIESKVVLDSEYCDGFPSRNISNWVFQKNKLPSLITEFKPDFIFIDRQKHFGLAAIKTKIPLLVHLRGDFWSEIQMAKSTIYKSVLKKIVINKWEEIGERCLRESNTILPICNYLSDVVKNHYPEKNIHTLYQGIEPSNWYNSNGMRLKHPCVGLVQSANIYEKTKEMLTLEYVIKNNQEITFYWAGDGPYKNIVLEKFKNYQNFKWIGNLEYPSKVRDFLSEIDVYALISGLDMAPLTLLEAQLMKKPVIATRVGGIPELMLDKKTGFLVNKGDSKDIIDKISLLINDERKAKNMGDVGRQFVQDNFNWDKITRDFIMFVKTLI